jgi:hypothetical protein
VTNAELLDEIRRRLRALENLSEEEERALRTKIAEIARSDNLVAVGNALWILDECFALLPDDEG